VTRTTLLGFPRLAKARELKRALEDYWAGKADAAALLRTAAELRARHWKLQREAGVDLLPSGDFSLYDHVLDTCAMVGAVPERFGFSGGNVDLDTFFAMARGASRGGKSAPALDMTKWFDTNYHYLVPELRPGQAFRLASTKPFDEFAEAKALGFETRPVLVGPASFLLLAKGLPDAGARRAALEALLPVYEEALRRLAKAGAAWVQIDEPCAVLDLAREDFDLVETAVRKLTSLSGGPRVLLSTYFEGLRGPATKLAALPAAVHVDLCRAPDTLDAVLGSLGKETSLSMGVVDGRNVWRADLDAALALLERAKAKIGSERIWVAPSCSLLHSPIDLEGEDRLDPELRSWLAFAKQKLSEVVALARALDEGRAAAAAAFDASRNARETRRASKRVHDPAVAARLGALAEKDERRASPFAKRREAQRERLGLPRFPTTTIGSFPQTKEVRSWRAKWRRGELSEAEYDRLLREETERTIRWQEEVGLDVLVHGEFERNDMVEYFGEQMKGFAFTENGWVQSYGSRAVKPPILFGDVSRPEPMTLRWARFAQGLTERPMKGMLTGPVTILKWSFARDDVSLETSALQIALALRDEVKDLEAAGLSVIQIDEPAIREGMPLRKADRPAYLRWAVRAFRIAASGVRDETQIHTHMCYSEFGEILEAIAGLDADVLLIEASRSGQELLRPLGDFGYPNDIGTGVYDIHSPRVPSVEDILKVLEGAASVLDPRQIWVNPDCGLKTRGWAEVKPALENLVAAAHRMRESSPAASKR